jgi:GxxExxY protein
VITEVKPQRHREHRDGLHHELTQQIIAAAIDVHRAIGPGLLESVYEACLAHELALRKVPFESQKQVLVRYKGVQSASDLRADLIVDGRVVVELKAVDQMTDVHRAQILTYMRLANCGIGLLINFNVAQLVKGVERFAL